jgi:hypothetical protein
LKSPHLLGVAEGPERFAPLLAALRAAGLRVGWLELRPAWQPAQELARQEAQPPASPGCPASLETAAALGVQRAVAAGGGHSLALKPLRGEPVLRDLVREHFLGCTLVLVHGAPPASLPALSPAGDGWRVSSAAGDTAPQQLDTPGLLAALRRPHPWGELGRPRR